MTGALHFRDVPTDHAGCQRCPRRCGHRGADRLTHARCDSDVGQLHRANRPAGEFERQWRVPRAHSRPSRRHPLGCARPGRLLAEGRPPELRSRRGRGRGRHGHCGRCTRCRLLHDTFVRLTPRRNVEPQRARGRSDLEHGDRADRFESRAVYLHRTGSARARRPLRLDRPGWIGVPVDGGLPGPRHTQSVHPATFGHGDRRTQSSASRSTAPVSGCLRTPPQ